MNINRKLMFLLLCFSYFKIMASSKVRIIDGEERRTHVFNVMRMPMASSKDKVENCNGISDFKKEFPGTLDFSMSEYGKPIKSNNGWKNLLLFINGADEYDDFIIENHPKSLAEFPDLEMVVDGVFCFNKDFCDLKLPMIFPIPEEGQLFNLVAASDEDKNIYFLNISLLVADETVERDLFELAEGPKSDDESKLKKEKECKDKIHKLDCHFSCEKVKDISTYFKVMQALKDNLPKTHFPFASCIIRNYFFDSVKEILKKSCAEQIEKELSSNIDSFSHLFPYLDIESAICLLRAVPSLLEKNLDKFFHEIRCQAREIMEYEQYKAQYKALGLIQDESNEAIESYKINLEVYKILSDKIKMTEEKILALEELLRSA